MLVKTFGKALPFLFPLFIFPVLADLLPHGSERPPQIEHEVGDSITVGLNSSPTSLRWSNLFFIAEGFTTLLGNPVSATQIVDQISDAGSATPQTFLVAAVAASDRWAWLSGYNDMRFFGTDANGLETYTRALRAAAAWTVRLPADKHAGNDAGWTKTGSWSQVTICHVGTIFTTTSGDKASIVVSGTAVTVAFINRYGLGDGALATVKIDGVTVDTYDTNFGSSSGFSGGTTTYAPMAKRYAGLSPGNHTVELTHASTTGKFMQIMFVAGTGGAATPVLYVGSPLKMNVIGYAAAPPYNNGSDAAVASYTTAIRTVLAEQVADGYSAKWADTNSFYSISTDVSGDNIHPNNTGHSHIRDAFVAAGAP